MKAWRHGTDRQNNILIGQIAAIMTQFPYSILTERLSLRRYTSDSANELFNLVERNRHQLKTSFAPMAEQLIRIANVMEFINTSTVAWNQGTVYQYGIHRRFDDKLIGQIKIKNVNVEKSAIELSYFIDQAWQRKGFAKESVMAIMRLAFEKMHFKKINVRIIESNIESLHLANRLGFVEEQIRKHDFVCGFGEVHDVHYLGLHNRNLH